MAQQLGTIKLSEMLPHCRTLWLEVGAETCAELSPGSQRVIEAWRQDGISQEGVLIDWMTVAGEAFWQSQEISECPAMIEKSVQWMDFSGNLCDESP